MRTEECYGLCCKYHGQVVRIQDVRGQVHFGRIIDVREESVWLQPVQAQNGGFGYGGYDDIGREYDYDAEYDYYYGAAAAYELAFGFIVGIALAALFFF